MNGRKKEKTKRLSALLLVASIVGGNILSLPTVYGADGGTDISWTQEALAAAQAKGYDPTGLAYHTSESGLHLKYAAMGSKQYLKGKNNQYQDFTYRMLYCVDKHEDNGGKLLEGAQAFCSNIYATDHMPIDFLNGVPEEQKKFNFLVLAYAAAYQSKQEPSTLDSVNGNVGVDILVTCGQMATTIADTAPLTGSWEEDFHWYQSVVYPRALDAVGPVNYAGDPTTYRQLISTDIPQWTRERGCINRAQAIFCYVWTAAKLSYNLQNENDRDTWHLNPVQEEDGMYHVRIPLDGENQYIVEYLRTLQAETYGDWKRQEDTTCIHFVSPSGSPSSEGCIARLTVADGEGMIVRSTAKAKLYEFKFYSKNKYDIDAPGSFDYIQSYFSSVMDDALEIYVIPGLAAPGGSTEIEVRRYEHEESWNADYNVKLIKYDSETGKPLEGAHFDILESFDDSQLDAVDLDLMGADGADAAIGSLNATDWGDDAIESNYDGDTGLIRTEGLKYNWANDSRSQFERWDDPEEDPCGDDDDITDVTGLLTYRDGVGVSTGEPAHFDVKSYDYHKGYCDGHPAPVIEYEEPDDDEEGGGGEDDGEKVDAYNQQLHEDAWSAWYGEVETCAELAREGGFFHAIDPDVAREAMEADRDQFYEDFISLTYDYSARETVSRKGYIRHGLHADDIPNEWRTVTSSQYKDFAQNGISHTGGKTEMLKATDTEDGAIQEKQTEARSVGEKEIQLFSFPGMKERNREADRGKKEPRESSGENSRESSEKDKVTFIFIDEDTSHPGEKAEKSKGSGSDNAGPATGSDIRLATPSDAIRRTISFTGLMSGIKGRAGNRAGRFWKAFGREREGGGARSSVSFLPSEASTVEPGTGDTIDWTFINYDHRTEGEIHINKRDLELTAGQTAHYDSYGDSQGDGTLEGAVYGLFASADLVHPDGKTGVVFQKDDLVALAATDPAGDASFLAITEAPGTRFNYETGDFDRTGFNGPGNLYTDRDTADQTEDNERFEGHGGGGENLSLADSGAGTDTGFQKLSSNQGVDETGDSEAGYPIQDNADHNGNVWIGRPLILSQEGSRYYVMELSRSEGYELSRYGVDAEITNREADAAGELPSAEGAAAVSAMDLHRAGGYNQFTVVSKGTTGGYDILVSGLMEGAGFYTTRRETLVNPGGTHTELRPVKEPVYGLMGSQVIIDGRALEAEAGDIIALPNGEDATVGRVSEARVLRLGVRPANAFQVEPPVIVGENREAVHQEMIDKVNESFKKAGYKVPGESAPWALIPLSGTTEESWCRSISAALEDLRVFNAFSLDEITQRESGACGILRYAYLQAGTAPAALYDEERKSVWVKKTLTYQKKGTFLDGYLYVEYPESECEDVARNPSGFITQATVKKQSLVREHADWGEELSAIRLKDEKTKSCWVYGDHEQAYDNRGNLVYQTYYESVEEAPGYEEKRTDTLLPAVYDAAARTYTIHIEPGRIPEDGIQDYRIKYGKEYVDGTSLPYTYYVQQNAILSVLPSLSAHTSYIEHVMLLYPGQEPVFQDAGTRRRPIQVLERPIRQKIKIIKDIETTAGGTYAHNTNADSGHSDEFVDHWGGKEGGAASLDNFRFKLYLKSNLERLYRDENGFITWLDREGREVDIAAYQRVRPRGEPIGRAWKLYTKVSHRGDSGTTGSISNNVWEEAVEANRALYSYDAAGLIRDGQNLGYTRILETVPGTVEDGAGGTRKILSYNYEKFFDAVETASADKWDRIDGGSTSFKPPAFIRERILGEAGGEKEYPASHNNARIDGKANTSEAAGKNAGVSDRVRQFAVTWYLDDEAAKLTGDNGQGEKQPSGGREDYQEAVYDRALQKAIQKAQNYLKPFFACDLDAVYAIEWDGEEAGGTDADPTTLSADTLCEPGGEGEEAEKDGYYYGISRYLPYGVYVRVEQQPHSAALGDFYNKHYRTDRPREIILPSVYEPEGNKTDPEAPSQAYEYQSGDTPEDLTRDYHIRLNEEWPENHTEDLRGYVIRAHNNDGDYEIYKYGLGADRLSGAVSGAVPHGEGSYAYRGFTVAQEKFDPYKDIYEAQNPSSDYPVNQKVEQYYRYASVSEEAGVSDSVLYRRGPWTEEGESGFYFQDRVKTMTGALTAYDGLYSAALVPWTVTEPAQEENYDAGHFTGYADGRHRNTFYTAKLRIEKLDAETGENILHDGAVFSIYSAAREDGRTSGGEVRFYDKDTVITGSREFLEAMGAREITPLARPSLPWQLPYNGKYYGTVSAGTPVCAEREQVIMKDGKGKKTGQFHVYSTTGDREMADETEPGRRINADQNTGYLETPEPLGAGCYVLAELKSPSGYTRGKPIAIEVYSDQVAYYLDGDRDNRVISTVYEEVPEKLERMREDGESGISAAGNKQQGGGDIARIYVNNTPLRLEISKTKPDEDLAAYELNGRLEGSLTELKEEYGLENLELAYNASGKYLGYGWRRGFLESLKQKQAAGESVEILYEAGVFTGKGRLYKTLWTADDTNRYLPGARMTLCDAIEVKQNGDREDYRYDGVNVERDRRGNVTNLYVQKGFAGNQIRYVLDKTDPDGTGEEDQLAYTYGDQEDDKGAGVWIAKTVEREDTDILFYDLGGLDILKKERGSLYGYDRNGGRIQARDGESIFALKNGAPFLEIVCGDYPSLRYSGRDRVFFQVPENTECYHLDDDGSRDSCVDPYTGMAYVEEKETGKRMVWPVKVSRDAHGTILAREKIATSRIASICSDTENEYTVGTYDIDSGSLEKWINPVLDKHGLPKYYQKSEETYTKGQPVYDRDGDYARYRYDDKLKSYNDNAYQVKLNSALRDIGADPETETDDAPLCRRQGESYLMENTWITGERTPNDPFTAGMTDGQADILKRVPAGVYIMEELQAPQGYVKAMPAGITVEDGTKIRTARATDRAITAYFEKVDEPKTYTAAVLDRDRALENPGIVTEGGGNYTYEPVEGARLALYRARRVRTDDTVNHPSGYRLEKTERTPAVWPVLGDDNRKRTFTACWTTGKTPKYMEAVPKGYYILEELQAPSGYVPGALEIEVKETGKLQLFRLPNDHTKAEIFKYMEDERGEKTAMPNKTPAQLALYEARIDENGIVVEDGIPQYDGTKLVVQWITDDCREYTGTVDRAKYRQKGFWDSVGRAIGMAGDETLSGFTYNYEKLLDEYGPSFETFTWNVERTAERSSREDAVFLTSRGERIVIADETIHFPDGMREEERDAFALRYQGNPEALTLSWLAERSAERLTSENTDREEAVRQLWRTDTGSQVAIHAVRTLTPAGAPGYVCTYRFNYRKPDNPSYPNLVSYDTPGGNHRLDYLPFNSVGKSGKQVGYYVLAETGTPPGFARAKPKAVVTEETADIQLYALKNEPNYIEVEKVDEAGDTVQGAGLALYRAAGDGTLVTDPAHLFAAWFSGPQKSRRIAPLPDGVYYLTEWKAPAGYQRMEPVRFEAGAEPENVIRAVNRLKQGIIRIEKSDAGDREKKLSGARFEIRNLDTGETMTLTTDEKGQAESRPIRIGTTSQEGNFLPYRFRIRESAPPDTYRLNLGVHQFQFEVNQTGKILQYHYRAEDRPTEIQISKSDFGDGSFVRGARLAVYRVKAAGGVYEAEGTPLEEWVSDGKAHQIKGKLSAGRTYLLKERLAPAGYVLAEPMLFTISDDGRRIAGVSDNRNIVQFHTSDSFVDAVESVTVIGRQAAGTDTILTDLDTGKEILIPSWRTEPLREEDGLTEGHRCEKREVTHYTDGGSQTSGRTIFRLHFDENGAYPLHIRAPERTVLSIETEDGGGIESWTVENRENSGYSHKIYNPEYEDGCSVQAAGRSGRYGAALLPGSIVKYEISYKNEGREKKDIRITAALDPQTEYMPSSSTGGGREFAGLVVWVIRGVEPGEGGSVLETVALSGSASGIVRNQVVIGGKSKEMCHPVASAGSLSVVSRVSGTAEERLRDETFQYRIELEDSENNPLMGRIHYSGSQEGTLKSGEILSLRGGGHVTLYGMAWGTRYKVSQVYPEMGKNRGGNHAGSDDDGERNGGIGKELLPLQTTEIGTEGKIGAEAASAVFLNKENDSSVREIFKKGERYQLVETTHYSDGSQEESGRFGFALDQSASVGGVDLRERPTDVIFRKTDITGKTELTGARLRILDEDGAVIEEWTTTEKPHELIAVLEPGRAYLLEELSPPDGYARERTLPFTVSEDGAMDWVRMEDLPTQVEISKLDLAGKQELAGARLTIQDRNGTAVESWESDGSPHRISGRLKAGETYRLIESAPPDGYWKAESVQFTVSMDGKVDHVEMRDAPTKIYIEKRGISEDGKEDFGLLEGARIQIRDTEGTMVDQFYTRGGEGHEITGTLKAGGTYRAIEIEAPAGYELAGPVTFTVPLREESQPGLTIRMEDRKKPESPKPPGGGKEEPEPPQVRLKKYDAATFEGLAGAEFVIYREDGGAYGRVTTGEDGRAGFGRPEPGNYRAVEVRAPEGYQLCPDACAFTVTESGRILGQLSIPNRPIEEAPILRMGTVTAYYERKVLGKGKTSLGRRRWPHVPGTGDSGHPLSELLICLLLLTVSAVRYGKEKRKHDSEKRR